MEPVVDLSFKPGLREKSGIATGCFADVNEYEGDNRWVVKRLKSYSDLEKLRQDLGAYDQDLRENGPELWKRIPEHNLIYGQMAFGARKAYVVMRKVLGEDLVSIKQCSAEIVRELENTIEESVLFMERSSLKSGKLTFPDLTPGQTDGKDRFSNMVYGSIDGVKKLYFVDTYPLREFWPAEQLINELKNAMDLFESEKNVKFSPNFMQEVEEKIIKVGEELKNRGLVSLFR